MYVVEADNGTVSAVITWVVVVPVRSGCCVPVRFFVGKFPPLSIGAMSTEAVKNPLIVNTTALAAGVVPVFTVIV